jgi:hypothetical protein
MKKKIIEIKQEDFKEVNFKKIFKVNYVDVNSDIIIIEVEED